MRAIVAFLVLALVVSGFLPAAALAQTPSLQVAIQNDCARDVRGVLRYTDPKRGELVAAFATTAGKYSIVQEFPIGKPMKPIEHVDNEKQPVPMLVYARIKDGATLWEGSEFSFTPAGGPMAGQQLGLKRFPYEAWDTGRNWYFRIKLACPGVGPVVLTAEQVAAAEKAKADEAARHYRQLVSSCDIHNVQGGVSYGSTPDYYASKVTGEYVDPEKGFQEARFREDVAREQNNRRDCFAEAGRIALSAEDKADLAARLARSDGEVAENVRQARAAVEADPRRYVGARLDEVDAAKARQLIELSRLVVRQDYVASRCGRFDYPMPQPGNNMDLNGKRAQAEAFDACVKQLQPYMKTMEIDHFVSSVRPLLKGSEPYVCSRWQSPVCVEDARWQRVAGLAERDTLSLLRRAREAWDEYGNVSTEVLCWRHKVNQAVDRTNGVTPQPMPLACQPRSSRPPPPP